MATLTKYDSFITEVVTGTHGGWLIADSDAVKVSLTDTAYNAAHADIGDITEINYMNCDWAAGGEDIQNSFTNTGGLITVATDVASVTCTASGTLPQFSYVVFSNSATGELIGHVEIGSAINLENGNTFTVNFAGSVFLTMS